MHFMQDDIYTWEIIKSQTLAARVYVPNVHKTTWEHACGFIINHHSYETNLRLNVKPCTPWESRYDYIYTLKMCLFHWLCCLQPLLNGQKITLRNLFSPKRCNRVIFRLSNEQFCNIKIISFSLRPGGELRRLVCPKNWMLHLIPPHDKCCPVVSYFQSVPYKATHLSWNTWLYGKSSALSIHYDELDITGYGFMTLCAKPRVQSLWCISKKKIWSALAGAKK